jgi:hypothetical protein
MTAIRPPDDLPGADVVAGLADDHPIALLGPHLRKGGLGVQARLLKAQPQPARSARAVLERLDQDRLAAGNTALERQREMGKQSLELRVMLDVEELEQQPSKSRRAADLSAEPRQHHRLLRQIAVLHRERALDVPKRVQPGAREAG